METKVIVKTQKDSSGNIIGVVDINQNRYTKEEVRQSITSYRRQFKVWSNEYESLDDMPIITIVYSEKVSGGFYLRSAKDGIITDNLDNLPQSYLN